LKKRYIHAINEAIHEEMARDPRVIVFGEDVELSILGETKGLLASFGAARVRDTPICEATISGMAVGAAAAGYRVIIHLMFANFIYTGFDAIANQMSKLRLMSGGQVNLPITVLAFYGGGSSQAAQHSDAPHPLIMNLSGINVVVPATPADAKGLLKTAIRGDVPTFFLEAIGLAGTSGDVPDGDYTVPLGSASIVQEGSDLTLVTVGSTLRAAQQAAGILASRGISVEILDVRSLVPFDEGTLLRSVAKTGRVVIVDEARECCSAASEIAATLAERGFGLLRAPIRRVAVPNIPMPYAPNAERLVLPTVGRIVGAAASVVSAGASKSA
jgi:acetoin:2,6-dichlorophenolindophenol oxidoreductase subunit beta